MSHRAISGPGTALRHSGCWPWRGADAAARGAAHRRRRLAPCLCRTRRCRAPGSVRRSPCFLREPPGFPTRARSGRQPDVAAATVPGIAAGQALRSWLFWGIAVAFFLDVIAINGTLTHIVPLLTDRGIPRQAATAALSGTGFALIFGRILSGWCLDRFWGPYVAIRSLSYR
jgi:hypothetical protein